jgi:hypothetical protein
MQTGVNNEGLLSVVCSVVVEQMQYIEFLAGIFSWSVDCTCYIGRAHDYFNLIVLQIRNTKLGVGYRAAEREILSYRQAAA